MSLHTGSNQKLSGGKLRLGNKTDPHLDKSILLTHMPQRLHKPWILGLLQIFMMVNFLFGDACEDMRTLPLTVSMQQSKPFCTCPERLSILNRYSVYCNLQTHQSLCIAHFCYIQKKYCVCAWQLCARNSTVKVTTNIQ